MEKFNKITNILRLFASRVSRLDYHHPEEPVSDHISRVSLLASMTAAVIINNDSSLQTQTGTKIPTTYSNLSGGPPFRSSPSASNEHTPKVAVAPLRQFQFPNIKKPKAADDDDHCDGRNGLGGGPLNRVGLVPRSFFFVLPA